MGDISPVVKILSSSEGECKVRSDRIPTSGVGDEQPLAIITNIGDYGLGKSFLSNILLNYLKQGDSSFEPCQRISQDFRTENSIQSETNGIDMTSNYVTYDNGKYSVAIWDTEGTSDPTRSQNNANTIFGLAAYFSSVLLLNVKEKFTKSNMDQIQVFLQELRENLNRSTEDQFQDLIIVIRDWHDEEMGYDWEGGKRYMDFILSSKNAADGLAQQFFNELRHSFRSVLVFLMPIPNREVMTKPCGIEKMYDIQDPFKSSLHRLMYQIFFDLLEPRLLDNEQMTVGTLKTQLKKLESVFSNSQNSRPKTLANAIKENRIQKLMNQAFTAYQEELFNLSTRSNVGKQKQEELKQSALRQFAISCQSVYFADQVFIDIATKQLTEMIDERYVAYNNGSHPGSKKWWVVGSVMFGAGAGALATVIVLSPARDVTSFRSLLAAAIPIMAPHIRNAASQMIHTGNPTLDKSLVGLVTSLLTSRKIFGK